MIDMIHRKTKIVCTLGPATEDDAVLRELILSGMNVARLNFSHGTHETHLNNIRRIEAFRRELNLPIAIMLDTKGPEIRLETFENGKVQLKKGQTFTLVTQSVVGNAERASIKYKQVEFMTERLGQTFDGVISGVTEWGLYVELNENKCEGMIPIRDLDDDYYEFDEKNYCLRGRRKNKIYSLGDAITIKVARANLEKKQLDFALV